jgi:ABC-type glutathione transport system ATPase component
MTQLLEGRHLVRRYRLPGSVFRRRGEIVAVDDVSLALGEKEFLGLVGESGSGKSTTANILVGLTRLDAGAVLFKGQQVDFARKASALEFRKNVQMVFQDPYSSLDPCMTVGQSLAEPLKALRVDVDHRARCRAVLEAVGLSHSALDQYPHAFSGGQRQRIAIARALAPHPSVIVADEPVSALDVSIQAQVLNLLLQIRRDFGLSIILITHDLAVVEQVCDRVLVMQRGRVVEEGVPAQIFGAPRHPYTRALLAAVLDLDGRFPFAEAAPDARQE